MMQVEDQRADSKATAATLRDAFCDIVQSALVPLDLNRNSIVMGGILRYW